MMCIKKLSVCVAVIFCLIFQLFPNVFASNSNVKIGVIYYIWYHNADSWNYPVVDMPVLGFYNSTNTTVIKQHLNWIQQMGFDFVIISWWGTYGWSGAVPIRDDITKSIFDILCQGGYTLKICLQVEPWYSDLTPFQQAVKDYVYDTYVNSSYGTFYFRYKGKPLLLWYKHSGMNPNFVLNKDGRFTEFITGITADSEWVDKSFKEALQYYAFPQALPLTRHYSITPRFDESRIPGRIGNCWDAELTYLYERQWNEAINYLKQNKIDIIEVTTFNEYYERTMIEPHYDATAISQDPYHLFNLTRYYINKIKGSVFPTQNWYENPKTYAVVMGLLTLGIFLGKWFYDNV